MQIISIRNIWSLSNINWFNGISTLDPKTCLYIYAFLMDSLLLKLIKLARAHLLVQSKMFQVLQFNTNCSIQY